METTTSPWKSGTWQPSWERDPKFSALLKPYSTAGVIPDGERPYPELWDISNGCILWLPAKANVGEIRDGNLAGQPEAFFDHPILVLGVDMKGPRSAIIQFVRITSKEKRPVSSIPAHFRDSYLLIFPTEAHPNSGILLRRENEAPVRGMMDTSYVCLHEGLFSLEYNTLRCFALGQRADGYRYRLTKESFELVLRELSEPRHVPGAWVETGALWEDFVQKYVSEATLKGIREKAES